MWKIWYKSHKRCRNWIDIWWEKKRDIGLGGTRSFKKILRKFENLACIPWLSIILRRYRLYNNLIILAGINAEGEIYGNFKLLVKRNPKENNFKAILGSIQ